jgi:UDP-N-acetylmuramate dehydrogenase
LPTILIFVEIELLIMQIIENQSLKSYNTFGIEANARLFADCRSREEIRHVIEKYSGNRLPICILGGGSNILFTRNFDGLIIKNSVKGIEKLNEDNELVHLKVSAGEDWDGFVAYCVEQGFSGIENLSLIPGNVGSCPIQNIGAYGMEVKETIESVEVFDMENLEERTFSNEECNFGYRDSIFKHALKGKLTIVAVNFLLSKKAEFVMNYGNVAEELKKYDKINLSSIRDAIIQIRRRKLPDPAVIGNAGSFFKNPIIEAAQAVEIKKYYPSMPHFVKSERKVKVPAAWLIEQCGWKGRRMGAAGVHENQPLVIVNHGNATGTEIVSLAKAVKDSVRMKFNIELEFEVNIL